MSSVPPYSLLCTRHCARLQCCLESTCLATCPSPTRKILPRRSMGGQIKGRATGLTARGGWKDIQARQQQRLLAQHNHPLQPRWGPVWRSSCVSALRLRKLMGDHPEQVSLVVHRKLPVRDKFQFHSLLNLWKELIMVGTPTWASDSMAV